MQTEKCENLFVVFNHKKIPGKSLEVQKEFNLVGFKVLKMARAQEKNIKKNTKRPTLNSTSPKSVWTSKLFPGIFYG